MILDKKYDHPKMDDFRQRIVNQKVTDNFQQEIIIQKWIIRYKLLTWIILDKKYDHSKNG